MCDGCGKRLFSWHWPRLRPAASPVDSGLQVGCPFLIPRPRLAAPFLSFAHYSVPLIDPLPPLPLLLASSFFPTRPPLSPVANLSRRGRVLPSSLYCSPQRDVRFGSPSPPPSLLPPPFRCPSLLRLLPLRYALPLPDSSNALVAHGSDDRAFRSGGLRQCHSRINGKCLRFVCLHSDLRVSKHTERLISYKRRGSST